MVQMTELEYKSLVELRNHLAFQPGDNEDPMFQQYRDDVDRVILNRHHTLSVLAPNDPRLALPVGLQNKDVRLKGTNLSRTAFPKAL
jgi:hypothetical protein